ncbi:MAG: hypothetical protein WAS07_03895 [Micropruina sp.]
MDLPVTSRRSWIVIGSLIALVAVLATVAIIWLTRPSEADLSPYKAKRPAEAVRGYLDGLAAANAATALGFGARPPVDATYLTDAVLVRAKELAPLKIETVGDVEGVDGAATVPARVSFGDQAVDLSFVTTQTTAGWRVQTTTSLLDVSTVNDGMQVVLNGVPVSSEATTLEVFPGGYSFGDSAALVDLTTPEVTVAGLGTTVSTNLAPTLAATGEATLLRKAKAALKTCLAKKDHDPEGCPNTASLPVGATAVAKTVKWSLVGDPWKKLAVKVDNQVPLTITGSAKFTFNVKLNLTKDKQTFSVSQKVPYNLDITLDAVDPDAAVTWRRV